MFRSKTTLSSFGFKAVSLSKTQYNKLLKEIMYHYVSLFNNIHAQRINMIPVYMCMSKEICNHDFQPCFLIVVYKKYSVAMGPLPRFQAVI